MKITVEVDVNYVRDNSWAGAKDRVEELSDKEIETILAILEDCGEMDATALNDFFWFEDDVYAEWLGYEDADEMWSSKSQEDDD